MSEGEKWPWAGQKIPAPIGGPPAGGYLAAMSAIPASLDHLEGTTISEILKCAISRFVNPYALLVPPDDVSVKVRDRFLEAVDKYGLGSQEVVDFVAQCQRDGTIKSGFYRICKDLGMLFEVNSMSEEFVLARRQWNDCGIAAFQLDDVSGLHWSQITEGVNSRSPVPTIHGYVSRGAIQGGQLTRFCCYDKEPHDLEVCLTENDNSPAMFKELTRRAGPKPERV